jgi:hypothetical protein
VVADLALDRHGKDRVSFHAPAGPALGRQRGDLVDSGPPLVANLGEQVPVPRQRLWIAAVGEPLALEAQLCDFLAKPVQALGQRQLPGVAEEFIEHLMKFGNADNRYLIYGYNTFSQDLHMLDQLVWAARRLVVPLDERIGPDWPDGQRPPTRREILTRQPDFRFGLGMLPLDDLIRTNANTPLRFAALNLNFSFAPSDFQHMPMLGGHASFNPVIYRHIFEPLAEGGIDPDRVEEASQLADWLIQNIQLPDGRNGSPDIAGEIKDAVAKAKTKHRLP